MLGAPLQNGFDSHLSPDGNEWVIYEADQILPFYIVHYKSGAFAYVRLFNINDIIARQLVLANIKLFKTP